MTLDEVEGPVSPDVESLRGIGRMSRESGLSVSALRFYDGAGLLSPARVDPRTGYRSYAPEQVAAARLVAVLRRVGMPLAGIRRVLAHRQDRSAVDALLAEHLRCLEQGLVDARRELSALRSLLDAQESPVTPTTATVLAADLAAALRAVRFAVGADPDLPVLGGVLFDVADGALTLVATDRYRLAVAPVPVRTLDGPPAAAVVPAALADRIAAAGTGDAVVTLTVDGLALTADAGGAVLRGELLADAFPAYRTLLDGSGTPVPVGPGLRAALAAAPTRTLRRDQDGAEFEAAVLGVDGGELVVDAGPDGTGVNREFLLEALDAGGPGQLVLSLDGPVTPLVLRSPGSVSLLMPVRI